MRSNCCPRGIQDQHAVEKQLASSPEKSSTKIGAAESIQDKVEAIDLRSRASQEVPEKAEQPKKPVKSPLKRLAKNPKVQIKKPRAPKKLTKKPVKKPVNTEFQEVPETTEQPKKPVKKPLKRLAKNPKVQVKKPRAPKKLTKKPVKKPDNTASQEVPEKAEQPKKPVKKLLKRLAKTSKVQFQNPRAPKN